MKYEETYHFKSFYKTKLQYIDGQIVWDPFLDIFNCWKTIHSTTLLATTTRHLKEDVINKFFVARVIPESEKIRFGYSILVKQYALTPDAYQYVEDLKKFTELGGTIFDPVPSRITGNVFCVSNPEEPVVGYLSCYNVQEERIFISPQSPLPLWFQPLYKSCPEEEGIHGSPNGWGAGAIERGVSLPVCWPCKDLC